MKTPITSTFLNKIKRGIIAIAVVILSFGQPVAVHAQAAGALAPLVNMGAQMAMQLVPMLIPVVMTGVIMGAKAGSQLPALVKERVSEMNVPRPHLPGRKKHKKRLAHRETADQQEEAAAEEQAPPAEGEETVEANADVSAVVEIGDKAPAKTLSVPQEAEAAPEGEAAAPIEEQPAKAPAPPKAKDASEWYMD